MFTNSMIGMHDSGETRGLSIIVPANNEAAVMGRLLDSLLGSEPLPPAGHASCDVQIIIVANGCRDDTAELARSFQARAAARDWLLAVLETPVGDKLNALNIGDEHAIHGSRVYLDADVVVSPGLLPALTRALDRPDAVYVCGSLVISEARSPITRRYARFWRRLPFVSDGAPGCGLFAVNAAGRATWGRFPDIISDDTFVRLQFPPDLRVEVGETYTWPMVEGFRNLVRVRRRQDEGVAEVARLHPQLMRNEAKSRLGPRKLLRLAFDDPAGFLVYAAVSVAVRLPAIAPQPRWVRGR